MQKLILVPNQIYRMEINKKEAASKLIQPLAGILGLTYNNIISLLRSLRL